jgi:hypothetical protein
MTQELLTENLQLKEKVKELELEIQRLKEETKELSLRLTKQSYSSLYED